MVGAIVPGEKESDLGGCHTEEAASVRWCRVTLADRSGVLLCPPGVDSDHRKNTVCNVFTCRAVGSHSGRERVDHADAV